MSSTSTKSSESVGSTAEAYAPPADQGFWSRAIRGIGICLLPMLVALYVGATTFGGSFIPWHPNMVDLEVYRHAGSVLLAGGDFYDLQGNFSSCIRRLRPSWRCPYRYFHRPWFRLAGLPRVRSLLSRSCTASDSVAGCSAWLAL